MEIFSMANGKDKMSDQPPSYDESNLQSLYGPTSQQPQTSQAYQQPSYDMNGPGNSQGYSQPQYQQGYSQYPAGGQGNGSGNYQPPGYQGSSEYPDEKKSYPPPGSQSQSPHQGLDYHYPSPPPGGTYNPMNDPNVYKVKPQLVNITQANPQHLNPSYPEFQQREQQRWAQGDYPKQQKHGAPLTKGKVNPNNKFGGSAFPGRGGATYNNAARK